MPALVTEKRGVLGILAAFPGGVVVGDQDFFTGLATHFLRWP